MEKMDNAVLLSIWITQNILLFQLVITPIDYTTNYFGIV